MIRTYRKLPVKVKAVKWDGTNKKEILKWLGDKAYFDNDILYIKTLEGNLITNIGDYIIQGIKGEFYPCKPDIFHKTYEPV